MKTMVNEDRLFKLLPYFFENPGSVLVELAQNAARSGATRLDLTVSEGRLSAFDNGKGIDDPASLFVLADSGWSGDVEENQNPAGWGLFFLYSIAEKVLFRSRFGTVDVDCKRYLEDRRYRASVLDSVRPDGACAGFHIEARLKPGLEEKVLRGESKLGWFPLDITVNGAPVEKRRIDDEDYTLKTVYQGNRVYIDPESFNAVSAGDLVQNLCVIWYGVEIDSERWWKSAVVIDVRKGSPLTPVLPYRNAVKQDEKLDAFFGFLKKVVVEHCTAHINSGVENKRKLRGYMKTMGKIASQEELDRLKRFYLSIVEPYHYEKRQTGADYTERVIVGVNDSPLTDQELVVEGLDELDGLNISFQDDDMYDDLFLPEGVVRSVKLPGAHPRWLKDKVKKETVTVCVKPDPAAGFNGTFRWFKADIRSDAGIKVLAVVRGCGDGFVFYDGDPSEFLDIESAVFDSRIYCEDGDLWDSQYHDFEKEISEDIMKITGRYAVNDLLGGLSLAGVKPWDIKDLAVDATKRTLTIRTKTSGVVTLGIM